MKAWSEKLDGHWRAVPLRNQHRYTLLFFLGYLLLTIGVLLKVGFDTAAPSKEMPIQHIVNPVIQNKQSGAAPDSIHNSKKEMLWKIMKAKE